MGFKVRGYTRDVPQEKVRDYSLFAIACEGTDSEPDYFCLFNGIDRIKVDITTSNTCLWDRPCGRDRKNLYIKALIVLSNFGF